MLLMFVQTNMMAQNRFYKYDFLFDNCTTRLRDLVEKVSEQLFVSESIPQTKTFFATLSMNT